MSDIILSQRQESFCLYIIQDLMPFDAAVKAGYSLVSANTQASRLFKNVKVQARLHELRSEIEAEVKGKVVSKKILTEIERHEILSEIALARFSDFTDNDGHISVDGKDRLNNAALAELKTTDWKGGKDSRATSKTTTVRLRDPIAAIAELNKMQHIYEAAPRGFQDNRVINIIVGNENAKKLLQRVQAGERTGKLIEGEVLEEAEG